MTDYLTPLDAPALRAEGVAARWAFGVADKVRFGEIDVLGHVNNAAYLSWLENFRIAYFRSYGVGDYDGTPPRIVLRAVALEFLLEVKLGDEYILTGRTTQMRQTSFTMQYGVWVRGQLTTTGSAVIVNLDQSGVKQPLPEAWRAAFTARDCAIPAGS